MYREFLAAQPDHVLAATAARELHGLLMRTGKRKEAAAARKEFASLFRATIDTPAKAEEEKKNAKKEPKRAESKAAKSAAAGPKKQDGPSAEMKARIARLAKELKAATEAGDDQRALMLEAQLDRAKKRAGRTSGSAGAGGRAGSRSGGGFAARAAQIDFSKMDDRAAAQMVERLEAMRDRVAGRLDEKTRAQVDSKWAALRKHLDGGDKAGAQKLWVELRTMLFRRR